MFLDRYLSEYDDNLTGESYIDPMGTLVIWSAFGQKIFRNRVNSISNDVRNYTLNLFNHYIVRRMIADDKVQLSRKLINEYGGKDTLHFKYACLLYLENLFVFSVLQREEEKAVDSAGVLGSSKARGIWAQNKNNPKIIFTHKKAGQILVRQLSLGVSGRYKTPMMEMNYFDTNYHYNQPASLPLWLGAEEFVKKNPHLHKLSDELIEHLTVLLSQNSSLPHINFSDVPESIRAGFTIAFSSSVFVGGYARDYWLSVTDLDKGAAGALLNVLDENAASETSFELGNQALMHNAMKQDLPDLEQMKMSQISVLEPFLSDVMLLFTLLSAKKSRALTEVLEQWRQFGRDEYTLPQRAQQILNDAALINVLKGTALARMQKLLQLAETSTLNDQITLLIDYHKAVMQRRGQLAWLAIDSAGLVKVHARPSRMPKQEEWPMGAWYHNYYLPQFKSLVRGFQGDVA